MNRLIVCEQIPFEFFWQWIELFDIPRGLSLLTSDSMHALSLHKYRIFVSGIWEAESFHS